MNTCNTYLHKLEEQRKRHHVSECSNSIELYQSDSQDDMKSSRTHRYFQVYKKSGKQKHINIAVLEEALYSCSDTSDTSEDGSSDDSDGSTSSSGTDNSKKVPVASEEDNNDFDEYAECSFEAFINECVTPEGSPPAKVRRFDLECFGDSVGVESELEPESNSKIEDIEGTSNSAGTTLLSEKISNNENVENKSKSGMEIDKVILEDAESNFDILPEGWVETSHSSGMPVYLHKGSRVASFTKPYFLGSENVLNHDVPASAIPCLHYLKVLKEKQEKIKEPNTGAEVDTRTGCRKKLSSIFGVPVENVKEIKNKSFTSREVRKYCKTLFKLDDKNMVDQGSKTPVKAADDDNVVDDSSSLKSEQSIETSVQEKRMLQCPALPDNLKFIKLPSSVKELSGNKGIPSLVRDKILNVSGRSKIAILHDYVSYMTQQPPVYNFTKVAGDSGTSIFSTSIFIKGEKFGSGSGSSKKAAKLEAAQKALEILFPNMESKNESEAQATRESTTTEMDDIPSFFDTMSIEDRRITEVCDKTGQPYPYAILLKCLRRKFGLDETNIQCHLRSIGNQKMEYTMEVGVHTASAMCQSKLLAKQWVSQAILKQLNPKAESWGSLLHLYGNNSIKSQEEKKQELQEIAILQNPSSVDLPNFAILNKLFGEMEKLTDSRKFLLPADENLPSTSARGLAYYKDNSYRTTFQQMEESEQDNDEVLSKNGTERKQLSELLQSPRHKEEHFGQFRENEETGNQIMCWQEEMCESHHGNKTEQKLEQSSTSAADQITECYDISEEEETLSQNVNTIMTIEDED